MAWSHPFPNLRGARVVIAIMGIDRWGWVITHTRANHWVIEFDKPLPSGFRRASFDRSEFDWVF